MTERHLLLIVGMHRSGTSALCAALEGCGVSFGGNLLAAMENVNQEGFWEDAEVVGLNQRLLQRFDATWYSMGQNLETINWRDAALNDLHEEARLLLAGGFGDGPLEAIKDPRLCLTLPFWLSACHDIGLAVSTCVINRAPLEVAASLQKRDGFPLGYGLRLSALYRRQLSANLPADTLIVSYGDLLNDPLSVAAALGKTLPLVIPEEGLGARVKPALRHHVEPAVKRDVLNSDAADVDTVALDLRIEQQYPCVETLSALSAELVLRAVRLTTLGEDHARALATVQQRDGEIKGLSALHKEALVIIAERDTQIMQFDARLGETGAHLSKALDTLDERDQQLLELRQESLEKLLEKQALEERIQRAATKPIIGLLFRVLWRYAAR